MSPAKASTSNDTMVTTATVSELVVKPLSQTDNNKKDEPLKKAVDFSLSIIDEQLNKSKLFDDKIKLEVSVMMVVRLMINSVGDNN